jgi:inhibitor of KinA
MVTLTIFFDPDATDVERSMSAVRRLLPSAATHDATRTWTIPVCYDERYGMDLRAVSDRTGLSPSEIVSLHTSTTYTVYFLGFSPGFPYMGDLDARLALPRREEPRPAVPAGSVAIATRHTAIYPHATPGGWHILGCTPLKLFDPQAAQPALLAAGDSVRCRAITAEEYETLARDVAHGRYVPSCEADMR